MDGPTDVHSCLASEREALTIKKQGESSDPPCLIFFTGLLFFAGLLFRSLTGVIGRGGSVAVINIWRERFGPTSTPSQKHGSEITI
jgi:hypothetical protein